MAASVRDTVLGIIASFERGDVPAAVSLSMFPIPDLPCSKWSLLNRTLMYLSGTHDARGYAQWKKVNRFVKRGSKAIYILVPAFKRIKDEPACKEQMLLTGFMCKPIFRIEDTGGEELEYQQIELPEFNLINKADEWEVSVSAIPGNYSYYGYYSPNKKMIAMATSEETVFFHEIAHAAHEKIKGSLKGGQDPYQEIVAELSAASLCRMVGKTPNNTLGNSYCYIERFAEKLNHAPHTACMHVLAETEKVLNLILDREKEESNV